VPTYEYECNSCRHRFEKRQSFSDTPVAECPLCHGASRRVFFPAPIIFKGSGFYVTDSRKRGDFGGEEGGAGVSEPGRETPVGKKTASTEGSSGTDE